MPDGYNILEDNVRYSYEGVVWSHKIQEKQSDIYAKRFARMKIASIVVSALTSAGIITTFFTDPLWVKILSTIISFMAIGITTYLKTFDLQTLIAAHKATANRLLAVRDQYRILLLHIRLQNDSLETLSTKYGELVDKADRIYLDAPSTTDKAVKQAGKALKVKKDNTFPDEEIDLSLPESLRRTNEQ